MQSGSALACSQPAVVDNFYAEAACTPNFDLAGQARVRRGVVFKCNDASDMIAAHTLICECLRSVFLATICTAIHVFESPQEDSGVVFFH